MNDTKDDIAIIDENWIREFILSRFSNESILEPRYISREQLQYEIMHKRKGDMSDTLNVIKKMKDLGFGLCVVTYPNLNDLDDYYEPEYLDHIGHYDLQKFANLRGYKR